MALNDTVCELYRGSVIVAIPRGGGDTDLHLDNVFSGRYDTLARALASARAMVDAKRIRAYMAEIGARGGRAGTQAQAAARRANGKLGGRPRKVIPSNKPPRNPAF